MSNSSVEETNRIPIKEALNIGDLMKDGATFEVNFDYEEPTEQLAYKPEEVYLYGNPACLNITDEDTYQDDEPFENLAKSMTNVTPDGKIKKRIIREGYGNEMPDMATVTVEYNAYLEFNDEPFDSTYIRKKPLTFRLNAGQTILGLDLAVQGMKINEKAQFLIEPEYGYGALGCLERVPPNSVCLFEIEVKNFVDSGASYTFNDLPEQQQHEFVEIYKYASALCMKAKDLCRKGAWRPAIKEYNIAVSKLENSNLRDQDDEKKQQELLLRLYTNLAVVHTKLQEPRRGCTNCNKAFNMCKGTSLKPSAKLYFNNAKCLILLGEYNRAEYCLKQAQRLEPLNTEISEELKKLESEKKKDYEGEVAFAKACINPKVTVLNEFQENVKKQCKKLLEDSKAKPYILPINLSDAEFKFTISEVQKHGLKIEEFKSDDGTLRYNIFKPDSDKLASKVQQLTLH